MHCVSLYTPPAVGVGREAQLVLVVSRRDDDGDGLAAPCTLHPCTLHPCTLYPSLPERRRRRGRLGGRVGALPGVNGRAALIRRVNGRGVCQRARSPHTLYPAPLYPAPLSHTRMRSAPSSGTRALKHGVRFLIWNACSPRSTAAAARSLPAAAR